MSIRRPPRGQIIKAEDLYPLIDAIEQNVIVKSPSVQTRTTANGTILSANISKLDKSRKQASDGGGGTTPTEFVSEFWAEIINFTQVNGEDSGQFKYKLHKVYCVMGGYDAAGWQRVRSNEAESALIYDGIISTNGFNHAERNNHPRTTIGPQGNGIDISAVGFPAGMAIMPIPLNRIVFCRAVKKTSPEGIEWWFTEPNGIDGDCG